MKNHPELIDSILAERFQPKLQKNSQEIIVAIASLAIGGAEMIVTDWLNRTGNKNKVHLIVLRNKEEEWEVPYFVKVTRIENEKQDPKLSKHENRILNLKKIGQKYSVSG
ncbi:MAG: hypothetical protein RJA61_395, partial [Candidatus Parcubacteria bacterium]